MESRERNPAFGNMEHQRRKLYQEMHGRQDNEATISLLFRSQPVCSPIVAEIRPSVRVRRRAKRLKRHRPRATTRGRITELNLAKWLLDERHLP
jgi:hypothetical protein